MHRSNLPERRAPYFTVVMHLAVRTGRVWAGSRHRKPLALTMFAVVLAPVLCFARGGSDPSQPANSGPLPPVRQLTIQGNFSGKKAGQWASDLSGIACIEPPTASVVRHCLVVNDENQSAQFATISKGKFIVGSEAKLIGAGPSSSTVGSQPTVSCPNGEAAFEEFDGQGVSYSPPYFYVVGSRG